MKGNITLSRRNNNSDNTEVYLEIKDTDSTTRVIEIKMTAREFALVMTGLAYTPCEITEVITPEESVRLGKQMEHKTVRLGLELTYSREESAPLIEEAFKETQEYAEGWVMTSNGVGTKQPMDGHNITVRRWVEKENK